jgi:hypothetical protein
MNESGTGARRFTIDGDAALEAHLGAVCDRVRAGVMAAIPANSLAAVLLGGGYGRGEGGVLRTPAGDRPYNDLEFYVFVRGIALLAERRYRHVLHELGERLSPEAGLEVEFKVLTPGKLRGSPVNMFYYDLVMGNRAIAGGEEVLSGCEHHRDPRGIPLAEATRLLMNRCSGLLFAAERLRRTEFGEEEADYVGRNLAKARLAFGDVVLAAVGEYHWSCQERHDRLAKLERAGDAQGTGGVVMRLSLGEVVRQHAAGVEFKLHPVRSRASRADLAAEHTVLKELGKALWLWLEERRLGRGFATMTDYATDPLPKCPEVPGWRSRLVNLRWRGQRSFGDQWAWRYPRERLLRALAWLLWEEDGRDGEDARRQAGEVLGVARGEFRALVDAYAGVWGQFN